MEVTFLCNDFLSKILEYATKTRMSIFINEPLYFRPTEKPRHDANLFVASFFLGSFRLLRIQENLSIDKIESSFLDPESISILKLPKFIELLKQSGFSSTKHSIYMYKTYCLPFFFVGLILLAGAFTAKFTKNKKESVLLLLFCAVFGFLIYVVSEYIYSLGIADKLPTILASVSPSIITIVIGIYFIIYLFVFFLSLFSLATTTNK